ncbi:MAG: hypothetical protein AAF456_13070 [Planctomycetota bacterium]
MKDSELRRTTKVVSTVIAFAVSAFAILIMPAIAGAQNTAPGQTPAASTGEGTVVTWLNDARTAMAEGNFELAGHYIGIAELLEQRQPGQTLSYTPAMARDELAALQSGTAQEPAAAALPVRNELAAAFSPAAEPAMDEMTMEPAAPAMDGQSIAARDLLLKARQELARGEVENASQFVDQAKQFNVDFDAIGDSPRDVELLLFHQNNLLELGRARDSSYNQRAASFLLQQAKTLINYQDFDTATQLINQARQFPVEFTDASGNPDQLLRLIEIARSSAGTAVSPGLIEVRRLMSLAQLAHDREQWDEAQSYVAQARALNVPDSEFDAGETLPWQLELSIAQNRTSTPANTATQPVEVNLAQETPAQLNGNVQTSFSDAGTEGVVTADYIPQNDTTRNVQVAGFEPLKIPAPAAQQTPSDDSRGMQLYRSALEALDANEPTRAREYFELAWTFQHELDSTTRQSIQDHLGNMPSVVQQASGIATPAQESPFQTPANLTPPPVDDSDQAAFSRLQREVFQMRSDAERMLEQSPRSALEKMAEIRAKIAQSDVSPETRRPLLTIIDRDIADMQDYIDANISEIMNEEANAAGLEAVEMRQQRRMDIEQQIVNLTEDFNRLMDEQRYPEAEMTARQALELDPSNEAVVALMETAALASRVERNRETNQDAEQAFYESLQSVEIARTRQATLEDPIQFPTGGDFQRRAEERLRQMSEGQYDTESERQIWNLLKNQLVQGEYRGTLNEAISQLARQANVNIIIDRNALSDEDVSMEMPVDANLMNPISLQSALNVILGNAGLTFVVEDEVIKVTTRDAHGRTLKNKTYYVGDLVMPVTNFSGGTRMEWMQPPGFGNNWGGSAPLQMSSQGNQRVNGLQMAANAANSTSSMYDMSGAAMGQQLPGALNGFGGGMNGMMPGYSGFGGGAPQTGVPTYATMGPAGLGGVTINDFQPLIELIKQTIDPDSWEDANGEGQINPFVTNLSLIVSQTQEVQDQIQDLLEKLRELNDVQIVVEVRFITLRDDFFERVGVDFDFRINDFSGLAANAIPDEVQSSVIIGQGPQPSPGAFAPTQDLDVGLLQNTFSEVIPQIGGFSANTAANFGFAILSDIEVYFLLEAAKGDTRSNIMQAPTVTMFNGQSASVNDGFQRPFVTSVTPVVGDFAVAHQPIITIIPDGTSLNVNAVVSPDRRFVRMTLVPYFSQVVDVDTFTFDGSQTTRTASDSLLGDILDRIAGNPVDNDDDLEVINEGVTIQLPVIAQTTISTVVSVPDGGTVLMGGVKRMNETRLERGLPFLSNLPYINRLFKNVGIGRETSNLMMMVTPRIIIQEEEEREQVGQIGN